MTNPPFKEAASPSTAARSAAGDHITNEKIYSFNALIKDLCAEKGVNYIDLVPALCGDSGVLPEEDSYDGVHPKKACYEKWLDYLKSLM